MPANDSRDREKVPLSVRVPQRDVERIEQYARKHQMSKSDAARRLLDRGLRYNDEIQEIKRELRDISDELDDSGGIL